MSAVTSVSDPDLCRAESVGRVWPGGGVDAVRGNGHCVVMALDPPGQYADDRNLRARQCLWRHQVPLLDVAGWVLGLAGLSPGMRVLDAGCGNGRYLRALAGYPVLAAGCDLSAGMLRSVAHPALFDAGVAALPVRDGACDVVLAAHMLYHVAGRRAAVRGLRRVLAPGGVCIAVTNGAGHLRPLRALAGRAARTAAPGWRMRAGTHAFTAEKGGGAARRGVRLGPLRPPGPPGPGGDPGRGGGRGLCGQLGRVLPGPG
jgi:SAM-dependent methyltransferase